MKKEKSAKGVKGFLLYSHFNKKYFFRVYKKDKTFKDYDLCAEDIEIEILDDCIVLINGKLDYSNKVLGQ